MNEKAGRALGRSYLVIDKWLPKRVLGFSVSSNQERAIAIRSHRSSSVLSKYCNSPKRQDCGGHNAKFKASIPKPFHA